MSHKYVYLFTEGNGSMRELLGGKGANLAEMTSLGMPVPQGFTISTEACTKYYEDGRSITTKLWARFTRPWQDGSHQRQEIWRPPEAPAGLRPLRRPGLHARHDGHHFEPGPERRGGRRPIAGNTDKVHKRFAYDSYRRFIQMFSDVVMELSQEAL